jgi:hypothetical protein
MSIALQLFLGTIAGCLTQLLVNPVSVIQTRMMTQKKSIGRAAVAVATAAGSAAAAGAAGRGGGNLARLGFFGMAAHILRLEGVAAFYTGLIPAFILSTNPSIQFLVFDRLKALLLRVLRQSGLEERNLSMGESFVIGATSKVVATLATYPYILAKMRLQYKGDSSGGAPAIVYKGTLDVLLRTLKYEGFLGLYAGMSAQLLKSVLGAALMFMAKEKLADLATWMQKQFVGKGDAAATKTNATAPALSPAAGELSQSLSSQQQQAPSPSNPAAPLSLTAVDEHGAEASSRRLSATVQVPPAVRLTQR